MITFYSQLDIIHTFWRKKREKRKIGIVKRKREWRDESKVNTSSKRED